MVQGCLYRPPVVQLSMADQLEPCSLSTGLVPEQASKVAEGGEGSCSLKGRQQQLSGEQHCYGFITGQQDGQQPSAECL